LAGLPPAVVLVAELDPLRDEGLAYATRLQQAGVVATVHEAPGMVHGFFSFPVDGAHAARKVVTTELANALTP
jgi:acetyl esterase